MDKSFSLPVKHVSETAHLVAAFRAKESERAEARFKDPYARLLVGENEKKILERFPSIAASEWMLVLRTCILDELILRLIRQGVDTVINLAAGLDTRPYRLDLPPLARWVEVDLPEIIDHKTEKLKEARPRCELQRISTDLRDAEARRFLFRQIDGMAQETLVITEGLLGYLSPENVAALARDLAEQKTFDWWLMDYVTRPFLHWFESLFGEKKESDEVRIQFLPSAGVEFFEPHGWKRVEFKTFEQESRRLGIEIPVPKMNPQDFLRGAKESGIGLLRPSREGTTGI